MEFFRQEYWSGLPFPAPGGLPDPRTEPASLSSPALPGKFFTPNVIPQQLALKKKKGDLDVNV